MINYIKNEWRNKGEQGAIPISATNLKRIEDGLKLTADTVDKMGAHYVKACDVTKKLQEITYKNREWTATEDCWLSFRVSGGLDDDEPGSIEVDVVVIFSSSMESYSSLVSNTVLFPPSFFVKQGAVITYIPGEPSITCTAYGCL